ncbi:MAG: hypothetical protein ACFFAH_05195 [Promethearchaeota archaeon]
MNDIKLLINDKEIPLNPIMSVVLTKINLGFIEALKGIPEDKKKVIIEIKL